MAGADAQTRATTLSISIVKFQFKKDRLRDKVMYLLYEFVSSRCTKIMLLFGVMFSPGVNVQRDGRLSCVIKSDGENTGSSRHTGIGIPFLSRVSMLMHAEHDVFNPPVCASVRLSVTLWFYI